MRIEPHFATYALAVFLVAPLGIDAVALAATMVHKAFLMIAYMVLLRTSGQRPFLRLWPDTAPAIVSCAALAVIAVPASYVLSSVDIPTIVYLTGEFVIAALAYVLTLRLLFPAWLQSLRSIAGHILPQRKQSGVRLRMLPTDASAPR